MNGFSFRPGDLVEFQATATHSRVGRVLAFVSPTVSAKNIFRKLCNQSEKSLRLVVGTVPVGGSCVGYLVGVPDGYRTKKHRVDVYWADCATIRPVMEKMVGAAHGY